MSSKVALVTGGSSGIGEATALKVQELGYTTYAAARRVQRMEHLSRSGIRPLAMDVTDEDSMQTGVKQILDEQGRIDVLVNNAGYGSYGALEDVPLSEARYQFEVNVFGAARLTQLVLPQMREQRSGTIINITSMGGKIYTPLGAWYHATKFALEALSDCLRMEVEPFGINVVVIEPGGVNTGWGGIAAEKLRAVSGSGPYADQANAVARSLTSETTRRRNSPPTLIAQHDRQGRYRTPPQHPLRRRIRRQAHDLPARGLAQPLVRCLHAPSHRCAGIIVGRAFGWSLTDARVTPGRNGRGTRPSRSLTLS